MGELLVKHYAYWFILLISMIGLWGMVVKRNLIKKMIGMSIFQFSAILFFIAGASRDNATVPIIDPPKGAPDAAEYINPLPHTLMLTAIVVGVATLGVAMALIIAIYKRHNSTDEQTLLRKMSEKNEAEFIPETDERGAHE